MSDLQLSSPGRMVAVPALRRAFAPRARGQPHPGPRVDAAPAACNQHRLTAPGGPRADLVGPGRDRGRPPKWSSERAARALVVEPGATGTPSAYIPRCARRNDCGPALASDPCGRRRRCRRDRERSRGVAGAVPLQPDLVGTDDRRSPGSRCDRSAPNGHRWWPRAVRNAPFVRSRDRGDPQLVVVSRPRRRIDEPRTERRGLDARRQRARDHPRHTR